MRHSSTQLGNRVVLSVGALLAGTEFSSIEYAYKWEKSVSCFEKVECFVRILNFQRTINDLDISRRSYMPTDSHMSCSMRSQLMIGCQSIRINYRVARCSWSNDLFLRHTVVTRDSLQQSFCERCIHIRYAKMNKIEWQSRIKPQVDRLIHN